MKKSELPLYLKISPIYNKILQLAIAVICIIVLMNVLIRSQDQQDIVIQDHFLLFSQNQTQQAVNGLQVLLEKNDTALIDNYIESLSKTHFVYDVAYYDHTGLLVASSSNTRDIKSLFGLTSNMVDESKQYKPSVIEIRTEKLLGYLRFTLDQKAFSKPLISASFDLHETMRLIALFAVIIGFFLTRGFSRFSRQGFRLNK